ncbi:MAG: endolytic transglycosylase MltG [Oscillospiraceae bacterium]|nr:endolytic transglycosylase MltG [Oscillospiraceae bacterium]
MADNNRRRYGSDGEYIPTGSRGSRSPSNSDEYSPRRGRSEGAYTPTPAPNNMEGYSNNQSGEYSYRKTPQPPQRPVNEAPVRPSQSQSRSGNPSPSYSSAQPRRSGSVPPPAASYQPQQRTPAPAASAARSTSSGPKVERRNVINSKGEKYEVHDNISGENKNKRPVLGSSRGCLTVGIYVSIVLAVSVLVSFYIIIGLNDMFALDKPDVKVSIEVPKDADEKQVAQLLKEHGVIKYPFYFEIVAKIKMSKKEDEHFKHGTFELSTKTDYMQIITRLTRPASADKSIVKVTFPEGMNVEQYGDLLEEYSVCKKEAFLQSVNEIDLNYSFLKDIKVGEGSDRIYRLEGYLFPDTYEFYLQEGSKSAITKMLTNFEKKYKDEIEPILGNKTLEQVIQIASVIERETPDKAEMPKVSAVFWNRLNNPSHDGIGGKLQSDATMWYPYPTKEAVPKDKLASFSSKFDTTKIKGFMPGAICNPGLKAIQAAAQPETSDYYYFFTDKNNKHYYSKTLKEHNSQYNAAKSQGLIES